MQKLTTSTWTYIEKETHTQAWRQTPLGPQRGAQVDTERPLGTHRGRPRHETHTSISQSFPIYGAPLCAQYGNNTLNKTRFPFQETQNLVEKKQLPNSTR